MPYAIQTETTMKASNLIETNNYFRSNIPAGWWIRFGEAFLEDLREVLSEHDCLEKAEVGDIKEKYGSLTFDLYNGPRVWGEHQAAWEYISEHTCVKCGKFPVKMRDDGWMLPWCDECFKEHFKERKDDRSIEELTIDNEELKNEIDYPFNNNETRKIDMRLYYKKINYGVE